MLFSLLYTVKNLYMKTLEKFISYFRIIDVSSLKFLIISNLQSELCDFPDFLLYIDYKTRFVTNNYQEHRYL